MISGPYSIDIERHDGRWFVEEWTPHGTEVWGPFRWRWLARLWMAWVRED